MSGKDNRGASDAKTFLGTNGLTFAMQEAEREMKEFQRLKGSASTPAADSER